MLTIEFAQKYFKTEIYSRDHLPLTINFPVSDKIYLKD